MTAMVKPTMGTVNGGSTNVANPKVLVVEDEPALLDTLEYNLTEQGYSVSTAKDGLQALEIARAVNPDLLLLDIMLPGLDGFEVCRILRQEMSLPILILTVQADEVDKVLGLEMGADDYLTKPFGLRELLSRIRALLRRAYGEFAAGHTDLLFVADLVIDRGRGQVMRGEQLLPLTPIELRLLIYFAQNMEQALSRPQLLDAVWGIDTDVESEKIINVNIRRLRQKIELDPDQPQLLLTVPGIGYRLTSPGRQ